MRAISTCELSFRGYVLAVFFLFFVGLADSFNTLSPS